MGIRNYLIEGVSGTGKTSVCHELRRLGERPEDEFGGRPGERELIVRLHATKEDIPKDGVVIDATAPLECVVDEILEKCG